MDFNKARTFIEVVDHGGFTAAASYLRRTQQAISLQINSLEDDLGLTLLIRQGPNIILTADGERLYHAFKKHLVSIESAVQHLRSDKTKASGLIRIGAWLEGAAYYLPEVIKGFSKKYPLVNFEIHTSTDEQLEALLMANKIDLSYQLFTKNQRLLKKSPAKKETLVPVVSKSFTKIHGLPKTIESTLNIPVIDYNSIYSNYIPWIKKNRADLLSDAQKLTLFVQISNNIALKQFVQKGLGMGFLVQSTIQEELTSGELIELSFSGKSEPNWVEFDIVYKRQNSLGFVHKKFIEHVLEYREKHYN